MATSTQSDVSRMDGSLDFSAGVDSHLVTTLQSDFNPNGLPRNMLAWLVNGTIRNGGISPRSGWQPLGTIFSQAIMNARAAGNTGFYQGGIMYDPLDSNPYLIFLMGGTLYTIYDVDDPAGTITDLTQGNPALQMPSQIQQAFFCQAEQFLIVQSGDYLANPTPTLPLFWDGATLRRSNGIISPNNIPSVLGTITATLSGITTTGFTVPSVGGNITVTFDRNVSAITGTVYFYDNIWSGSQNQPVNGVYSGLSSTYTEFTVISSPTNTSLTLQVSANTSAISFQGANLAAGFYLMTQIPATSTALINELPGAGPMCYYMGRLWYAQGRTVTAGDIVSNQASGTAQYNFTDSVLKVTENPLALGGDGFTVPSDTGNIRGITYAATNNTQLGQGALYLGTRQQIYALQVPVTRSDWIGANANNMPLMYPVQVSTGWVNDRSLVQVNSDVFFQTLQPSIQSLQAAIRNFGQWGSVPVSINEQRLMAQNDRALLWAASGIYFDNRVLQTAVPTLGPWGVTHSAIAPLNFDSISSLNAQLPPAWEGQWSGLDILQLFEADFGGVNRAFALVISRKDQSLQLWELTATTDGVQTDNGDERIPWVIETPAFTWGKEFQLKELVSLEKWLDNISGTVNVTVEYRPDSDACWYPWQSFKVCAARNTNEQIAPTTPYPKQLGPGYKSTITLPHPPQQANALTGRPAFMLYQAQIRITLQGWLRVRGIFLHGIDRERKLYEGMVC